MKKFLTKKLTFIWYSILVFVILLSIGCYQDEDKPLIDNDLIQNSTSSALHRVYFRNGCPEQSNKYIPSYNLLVNKSKKRQRHFKKLRREPGHAEFIGETYSNTVYAFATDGYTSWGGEKNGYCRNLTLENGRTVRACYDTIDLSPYAKDVLLEIKCKNPNVPKHGIYVQSKKRAIILSNVIRSHPNTVRFAVE